MSKSENQKPTNFKFVFQTGANRTLRNYNFKKALEVILNSESDRECIKIVFLDTGNVWAYSKSAVNAFLNGELLYEELEERYQCDNVYRNTETVIAENRTSYYPGNLWCKKEDHLVLVDDDDYIITEYSNLFEVVN
ncbi:hypothetical protein SAMN05216480_10553 [Pustulibacterium marinum]|uniref:Uncharacterized protein n=1 Tax=Pustulibacterium marinum TaxID=1224947 RepID=A0A1I7GLA6_9FLAO|nr:hypothetical protein [Pustulibacterium marinum]SFU49209.1 hypothetical protein SAMN05216480_10553 [Pustulibacterium marinum]